jgi:RNA polymerase sigma-70 factor (sigma-E family)
MQEGPDDDFAAFVRARYPALLRSAVLLTGDHHHGQDLVQGALVKLAARWGRLREGSPEAYVRRILYNDNISRWRRTRREVVIGEIFEGDRPVGVAEPVDPGAEVTAVDVRRALQRLTAKQRAVVVLRYYEDLSEAQIAEVLEVSPGTVKSQAHLAMRRLRQLLPQAAEALIGTEEGR